MHKSLDFEALAQEVRRRLPAVNSAVLVGSAAVRDDAVEDLDVSCLVDGPPPEVSEVSFTFQGRRTDVLVSQAAALPAMLGNPELYLLVVREVRKILQGRALFDDGVLEAFKETVSGVPVPLEKLAPLAQTALETDLRSGTASARLRLHLGLENLVFCWLHLDLGFRYSKPKWMREDIRQLGSSPLCELADRMASATVGGGRGADLAGRFRGSIEQLGGSLPTGADKTLHDAEFLLENARELDAAWPLWMTAYLYGQWWAWRLELQYRDLRDNLAVRDALRATDPEPARLLTDALLMDTPPDKSLRRLWRGSREDFRRCWERTSASHRG